MNNQKKQIIKTVKSILDHKKPSEWVGFLFDIQNSLIATGDMESLTDNGAIEMAGNFAMLKNFFQNLSNYQQKKTL